MSAPETWRPLSDAEYAGLSLRGKVEHHRILAHEARRKAGPMWKDGRPAEPHELSQRWHEWTQRAEWHEAESARLAKHMRPAPSAMAAE